MACATIWEEVLSTAPAYLTNAAGYSPFHFALVQTTGIKMACSQIPSLQFAYLQQTQYQGGVQQPTTKAGTERVLSRIAGLPADDMEAWVNRPSYERRAEVRGTPGPPEPLTAFGIYFCAYRARAGQIWRDAVLLDLLDAIAISWHAEQDEVKSHYHQMARVDQLNHDATFLDLGPSQTPSPCMGSEGSREAVSDEHEFRLLMETYFRYRIYASIDSVVKKTFIRGETCDPCIFRCRPTLVSGRTFSCSTEESNLQSPE
ncbi:hypothetical protein N7451_012602 [Penicillium sp. IBT 35674x]|nr:hypothetical protein N7451_012602 [Penicillium sp. IBT 35674x]